MSEQRIRVMLVDDHPIVREGMRGMLASAPDIEVVGEAADGASAITVAAQLLPDVVLMDLRMPGMDGADATAAITAANHAVKVLIVTTYDTDGDILRAVEAGAAGYVLKDTPIAELVQAIRAAARGETVLAPALAAKLVRHARRPVAEQLTSRELEVLACVARGLSNAEAGRELYIGEATVKTHLARAFTKLGVDDRTAAVTTAIALGYLPPPAR